MKKSVFTFILLFCFADSYAQWINTITVFPANPNTNSQIKVLANLSFSSGSCDEHTQFLSLTGNTIYASALHCLGPLTFICGYTDTFTIGQLQAGNYRFLLSVNEGFGASPCSPGIVAGPSDSLLFTVSSPASIDELKSTDAILNYNSVQKTIDLKLAFNPYGTTIQVLSTEGRLLQSVWTTDKNISLDASLFKQGLYLIRIVQNSKILSKKVMLN